MDEFEIEQMDGSNPSVDGGIGLTIGVIDHTLNEGSIYLYHKIADTYEIEVEGPESTEESVKL